MIAKDLFLFFVYNFYLVFFLSLKFERLRLQRLHGIMFLK